MRTHKHDYGSHSRPWWTSSQPHALLVFIILARSGQSPHLQLPLSVRACLGMGYVSKGGEAKNLMVLTCSSTSVVTQ